MKTQIAVYTGSFLMFGQQILILQRSKAERSFAGLWEIPGGRMKPSETLLDACVRETSEETGIRVRHGEPVSVMEFTKKSPRSDMNCIQVNFLCVLPVASVPPRVALSSEHRGFKWVLWDSYGEGLVSQELRGSWRAAALKMQSQLRHSR